VSGSSTTMSALPGLRRQRNSPRRSRPGNRSPRVSRTAGSFRCRCLLVSASGYEGRMRSRPTRRHRRRSASSALPGVDPGDHHRRHLGLILLQELATYSPTTSVPLGRARRHLALDDDHKARARGGLRRHLLRRLLGKPVRRRPDRPRALFMSRSSSSCAATRRR